VPASLKHPREYFSKQCRRDGDAARRRSAAKGRAVSVRLVVNRVWPRAAARLSRTPRWAYRRALWRQQTGGEIVGQTYHQLFGVPFVSCGFQRLWPTMRPELALAVFTRAILEGTPLPLYGDGSVLRDFTHVSDICRGILTALTAPDIAGSALTSATISRSPSAG